MTVAGVIFTTGRNVADGATPLSPLGGIPMLIRVICAVQDGADTEQVIVLVDPAVVGLAELRQALDRWLPGQTAVLRAAPGGRHRALHAALSILEGRIETVVLHEACRPLASAGLVSRVLDQVRLGAPAAVPVVELTETVKELDRSGRVVSTVPRESLRRVQLPQAVRRSVLDAAHVGCPQGEGVNDDTLALTPAGTARATVPGEHIAFPVTDLADLTLAEAVIGGHGYEWASSRRSASSKSAG